MFRFLVHFNWRTITQKQLFLEYSSKQFMIINDIFSKDSRIFSDDCVMKYCAWSLQIYAFQMDTIEKKISLQYQSLRYSIQNVYVNKYNNKLKNSFLKLTVHRYWTCVYKVYFTFSLLSMWGNKIYENICSSF